MKWYRSKKFYQIAYLFDVMVENGKKNSIDGVFYKCDISLNLKLTSQSSC